MNYDKKYEIRLAKTEDIDAIMKFIDAYWKQDHILARNRGLFEYEHVDGEVVSFLIAVERYSNEIAGVLGYIPASKDSSRLDVWTGIWKVKDGVMPLLGMELYKRLQPMVGARSLLGVGDNPKTTGRLLRTLTNDFNTWRMNHYYFLAEKAKYDIAEIVDLHKQTPNPHIVTNAVVLSNIGEVEKFIDLTEIDGIPHKDLWYIEHRYFKHPVFKYEVYGLQLDDQKALMIIRLQEYKHENVARIVDYIGDQDCFSGIYSFISDYLKNNNCEYADFYVHGFEEKYIFDAGFVERKKNDRNIIPNYFCPFVRENIDIWVSGNIANGLFVKADGDQDRPN